MPLLSPSVAGPSCPTAPRRLSLTRQLVGAGLISLLVCLVFGREALYAWFAVNWLPTSLLLAKTPYISSVWALGHRLFQLLHRQHEAPIGILYAAAYISVGWAILGVLIPGRAGWRWGARLYGGLGIVSLGLLLASYLSQWSIPAQLANSLLNFLVTPLPVMVLLVLWHATSFPRPAA